MMVVVSKNVFFVILVTAVIQNEVRCSKNTTCTKDSDCPGGQVCQNFKEMRKCTTACQNVCPPSFGPGVSCSPTGHCKKCAGAGESCDADRICCSTDKCMKGKCETRTCISIFECLGGDLCIQGKCKRCTTDSDCGSSNLICVGPKCVECQRMGGPCSSKRECCACQNCNCVGTTCTNAKECKKDSDCPSGKVCGPFSSGRACEDRCPSDSFCKLKQRGDICASDGHCRACINTGGSCGKMDRCCYTTDTCQNGVCKLRPPPPCRPPGAGCSNPGWCCSNTCSRNSLGRAVC